MDLSGSQQIVFTNVGENDHLPYAKADIIKVCRISDNFAVSFYQLDYQAMAMNLANPDLVTSGLKKPLDNNALISVGKIVMDLQAFQQFYGELTQIKETLELELKK